MTRIHRNFSSPQQAVTFLHAEGFKPITSTPLVWKKVDDQRVREVHLHTHPKGSRVKVVEVSNGSQ